MLLGFFFFISRTTNSRDSRLCSSVPCPVRPSVSKPIVHALMIDFLELEMKTYFMSHFQRARVIFSRRRQQRMSSSEAFSRVAVIDNINVYNEQKSIYCNSKEEIHLNKILYFESRQMDEEVKCSVQTDGWMDGRTHRHTDR